MNKKIFIAIVLTLASLNVCIVMEIWNHLGGGVLPWKCGKFIPSYASRSHLRKNCLALSGKDELTQADEIEIDKKMQRQKYENRVIEAARTWALLQYLMAPLALAISIAWLVEKRKQPKHIIVSSLLCLMDLYCLVMLYYRGYWVID